MYVSSSFSMGSDEVLDTEIEGKRERDRERGRERIVPRSIIDFDCAELCLPASTMVRTCF